MPRSCRRRRALILPTSLLEPLEHRTLLAATAATSSVVGGFVFSDPNGNGVRDSGDEAYLANRTVYLDLDRDATRGADEPGVVTGTAGTFRFDVDPGTYHVRQVLPASWTQTSHGGDGQAWVATVDAGNSTLPQGLGSRISADTISGVVLGDGDG